MRAKPAGALEFVPAARLCSFTSIPPLTSSVQARRSDREVVQTIEGECHRSEDASEADVLEIPVHYKAKIWTTVAQLAGLTPAEVVAGTVRRLHRRLLWFRTGLGIPHGLDDALWLPRRAVPRTRVPAVRSPSPTGTRPSTPSVPRRLEPLGAPTPWCGDPERQPPAMFAPGARVRFVPQPGPLR